MLLRAVLEDPAVDGRVVNGDTPFLHHLFELAVA
jgi:hypothetical protein